MAMRSAVADPSVEVFEGHFQNYFSIGIDANLATAVETCRSHTVPGRCMMRCGLGKMIYGIFGPSKMGCCNCCVQTVSGKCDFYVQHAN